MFSLFLFNQLFRIQRGTELINLYVCGLALNNHHLAFFQNRGEEPPRRSLSETFTVPLPRFAVPDYAKGAVRRRAESLLTVPQPRARGEQRLGPSGGGAPVRDVHRQPLDVDALAKRKRFPEKR